jgi:sensor histidine kinase regulating citrate/malate metabolism
VTRTEEFIPRLHLAGAFGSEGVRARIASRKRLTEGLRLLWTRGAQRPLLKANTEALLNRILSARLHWRREQNIKADFHEVLHSILESSPSMILEELLCNAFDAHARANKPGHITLSIHRNVRGQTSVEVSDQGIGFKYVRQGSDFLDVSSNDAPRGWCPFLEGEVGVGLLWIKFLAESRRGSIDLITSRDGHQKTTISVQFPRGVLRVCKDLNQQSS